MTFEISTMVNYLVIAFVAFVFVMWFVGKAKEVWKPIKKTVSTNETVIDTKTLEEKKQ